MDHHSHHDYADARHDHRGEYAPDRHDHDIDYADRHHRHYDEERAVAELRSDLRDLRNALNEYERNLSSALARIRELEQQTPRARQLELEADQAAADLAESGYGWRDDEDGDPWPAAERPFTAVPRLRRVTCTRTVVTDGNPEPCGLPVDHDPDEKCGGNPHARPAPEAGRS